MSRSHITNLASPQDEDVRWLVSALEALEADLLLKSTGAISGPLWREVDQRMGRLERARTRAQDDPREAELS